MAFINFKKLKTSHQSSLFLLDVIMLILISVNLAWLLFDTLFSSLTLQSLLLSLSPTFFGWYRDHIHPDFVVYDLIFVSIFVVEVLFRWCVSVYQKEYHRWWFYPFVHWYDVLGCIPIGSFRFLRLLRVFSIIYRLQKFGVIDVRQSAVGRFIEKYMGVIVEEVSDRVVVNVLTNVKEEIVKGTPVVRRVADEVIRPREAIIAQWMSSRMTELIERSYHSRVDAIRDYVEGVIGQALQESDELQRYNRVPFLGEKLEEILKRVVSEVVFSTMNQIADDLHGDESTGLLHEGAGVILDHITQPEGELSLLVQSLLLETVDLVIEEVKIQKWKLEEAHV